MYVSNVLDVISTDVTGTAIAGAWNESTGAVQPRWYRTYLQWWCGGGVDAVGVLVSPLQRIDVVVHPCVIVCFPAKGPRAIRGDVLTAGSHACL
jgi:hypothetical protein